MLYRMFSPIMTRFYAGMICANLYAILRKDWRVWGLKRAARLGYVSRMAITRFCVCLGFCMAGFAPLPFNLAAGAKAMGHAISHSKCSHVFVDKTQTEVFNAGLAQCDATPVIIPVNDTINLPAPPRRFTAYHTARPRIINVHFRHNRPAKGRGS